MHLKTPAFAYSNSPCCYRLCSEAVSALSRTELDQIRLSLRLFIKVYVLIKYFQSAVDPWHACFNLTPEFLVPALDYIKMLGCGYNHSIAITNDGGVKVWGSSKNNELGVVDLYGFEQLKPFDLITRIDDIEYKAT